jgi:hypothetical protein
MYDEHCLHSTPAQWLAAPTTHVLPADTYHLDADPGRNPFIPIRQRWHKDLADTKGHESEPDESRRTKTRFARHYTLTSDVEEVASGSSVRSRSLEPLGTEVTSPRAWHDLLSATFDDQDLWNAVYRGLQCEIQDGAVDDC